MKNVERSNLRIDELGSVISTIFGKEPGEVTDFLIIIQTKCGNCDDETCAPLGMVSSRDGIAEDGTRYQSPAFRLHMLAAATEALAMEWSDERAGQ